MRANVIIYLMNKKDGIIFQFIFSAVIPIIIFLAFWWGSVGHVAEHNIFKYALLGFLLGIAINQIFFTKYIKNCYQIPTAVLIFVYLFYSVCIFGFFMGVPIFNLVLGPLAGLYIAKKITNTKFDKLSISKIISSTTIFVTITMILICVASGYIALVDPYTASNLKGMFGLSFYPSQTFLITLIVIGGFALVLFEYFLTKAVIRFYLKKHQ